MNSKLKTKIKAKVALNKVVHGRTKQQLLQKRKDNPKDWKLKQKIIISYVFLMVFYGFYTMILGIIAYAEFSGAISSYERIVDNLDNDIIVDIQPATTSSCGKDYISLFNYEWPGTELGCNCIDAPNTDSYEDVGPYLYKYSCSGNQTYAGCADVANVEGKTFELWNLNDKAQNICIKRKKNSAFHKNAPNKAECASDEILCGQKDFENSIFCVKQGEQCPIYDFVFDTRSNQNKLQSGYEEIQLLDGPTIDGNGKSLYITRYGNKQPISEIRITEGEGVCQENQIPNLAKGRGNYVLNKQLKKYCKKPDTRFYSLTESANFGVGEVDYFTIHQKYYLLQNLPRIDYSNAYIYNTWLRQFLEWDINYREELKQVVELESDIGNMEISQLFIMIVNIIVCLIVSIILSISQIYNLCGNDVPCIEGDGVEEQRRIKNVKKLFQYGAKFLQFPFMLWAFWASANNKGLIRKIADAELSDDQTNKELNNLAENIEDQVYTNNLQMLISFFVVLFVDIVMYLWKLSKRYKKKQRNKVGIFEGNEQQIQNSEEKEVSGENSGTRTLLKEKNVEPQILTPSQPQNQSSKLMQLSTSNGQQLQSDEQPQQPPQMPVDVGQLPPQPKQAYNNTGVQQPPQMQNDMQVQQPPQAPVQQNENELQSMESIA